VGVVSLVEYLQTLTLDCGGISWKSGRNTLAAEHSQARERLFLRVLFPMEVPAEDPVGRGAKRDGVRTTKRCTGADSGKGRVLSFQARTDEPVRMALPLARKVRLSSAFRFAVKNWAISVALRRLNESFPNRSPFARDISSSRLPTPCRC